MSKADAHTERDWRNVCERVRSLVPEEFGGETWYLIIGAVLAGSPEPDLLAKFYTYLTTQDISFSARDDQRYLSKRLRDVLFKTITLMGMPRVLCVLTPLAKAEGNVQSESRSSKLSTKLRFENMDIKTMHDRGVATAHTIYGPTLLPQIFDTWGSHREDMKFHEFFTAYGLYLSDFEVMTPLATEAVVYAAISCLGLKGPGMWHLRGVGRLLGARGSIGVTRSVEEGSSVEVKVKSLKKAVVSVVEFIGNEYAISSKLKEWATIDDIEKTLGGWGED